ncbi:hypothetical protein BpHYR1_012931 [Brachionus plicatilis]|uniref:Uncharacterized protein n=1 Tax=Brachionus plicatilis TaxID=10195 RepID=A0A3M7PHR3_BRAPC|nr:hypothetical protein BpHYR1_012931 [Brachionus plicatilis]
MTLKIFDFVAFFKEYFFIFLSNFIKFKDSIQKKDRIFCRFKILTVKLIGQMTAPQKVGGLFDRPFFLPYFLAVKNQTACYQGIVKFKYKLNKNSCFFDELKLNYVNATCCNIQSCINCQSLIDYENYPILISKDMKN